MHWTQKPENKARLKKMRRKSARLKKNFHLRTPNEPQEDAHTAYAFGYTQAWLQTYSERLGIAQSALTIRVGKLLQSASRR